MKEFDFGFDFGTTKTLISDDSQLAWADVQARDEEGKTALMKVAELGDVQAIHNLVEREADVNAKDNH